MRDDDHTILQEWEEKEIENQEESDAYPISDDGK